MKKGLALLWLLNMGIIAGMMFTAYQTGCDDENGGPPGDSDAYADFEIDFIGPGNTDDKDDNGCRIWYSVIVPGKIMPADQKELCKSFYTNWKQHLIEFEFVDSTSTAYFAV
jgi:hypothetical protein